MRAANKYLFLLGLMVTSSAVAMGNTPYRGIDISRAPSQNGTTGLITMNLPHTMGAGLTAVGGITQANSLPGVYDNFTEVVGALRVGLSDNIEIGLKTKNFSVKDLAGNTETGLGDSEAMIKWKFREQNENLFAMALGLGAILPTGDEDKGFSEVENLGIKFSVTAAGERAIDNGYIGLYFEGQIVAIDQMTASSPYKEMYGVFNVGLAFPISDDNRLAFFTEYNMVTNKDIPTVERDHTMVSPGLRYAARNISLTAAGQVINYSDLSQTQNRIVGMVSLGF